MTMKQNISAIILAAGKGTRMKSSMPKIMHKIAGVPMISHVIQNCEDAHINDIYCVINDTMDNINDVVSPHKTVIQKTQNGTADAVIAVKDHLKDHDGYITILCGDAPFISSDTLKELSKVAEKSGMAIIGFHADNPTGYGRLIADDNHVRGIIEEKDCSDIQRQITLCNGGAYCVKASKLFQWLDKVSNLNAQGEYYLTDIVSIATDDGVDCGYYMATQDELIGINSRVQLAQAEKIMQDKLRDNAMNNGVTMIAPETVYLSMDTIFGRDIIIEPNVFIGAGVHIGDNTHIHANSHIAGADIGKNAEIGPFARIRPKSKIGNNACVGNFIEVNRSEFKDGAKSKHVSYIGDAVIGEKTNIGAGTVFANYDGFNKHVSTTGKGSFIGSNSTIISPITIGDGAFIAAGSTIAKNVNADALAVSRAKQLSRDGWTTQYRAKNKKDK